MRRLLALLATVWLAFAQPCLAQNIIGGGIWGDQKAVAGGYTGPGDVVSGAKFWYGLRCYNTAYTGNVADVWDSATGSTTETLLTCSAGGTINQTVNSLATTCASGCDVKILYDQSGSQACTNSGGAIACDLWQTTNSKRPAFTQNCINTTLPCLTFSAASSQEVNISLNTFVITATPAISQQLTASAVALTTSVASKNSIIADNNGGAGLFLQFNTTPAIDFSLGTDFTVAASTSTQYAIQAVGNGASSILYINGSSNSGNAGAGTIATSALIRIGNDGFSEFLNGKFEEGGVWALGFSSGQQSSMNSNQRSYWGF